MKLALIVATDSYEDQNVESLRAPVSDATSLAEVLRDDEIGGFAVEVLANASARHVQVAIDLMFRRAGPDDTCLLYLNGHGATDAEDFIYCATDVSAEAAFATGVRGEFMRQVMARSECQRQVVLLDCCFSGSFLRPLQPKAWAPAASEFLSGSGRAVIASSTSTQQSFEFSGHAGPQSIFTECVVRGLATGAADLNHDGIVTVDEMYTYACREVRNHPVTQTPSLFVTAQEGNIEVARTPISAAMMGGISPDLETALRNAYPAVRLAALNELGALLASAVEARAADARKRIEVLANDPDTAVADRSRDLLQESHRASSRRRRSRSEATRLGEVQFSLSLSSGAEFEAAVQRMSRFPSGDRDRPLLGGLLLDSSPEGRFLVATDSYRLARLQVGPGDAQSSVVLFDAYRLQQMPRLARSAVEVHVGVNAAEIVCRSRSFLVPVLSGEYPNWRKLMNPVDTGAPVRLNRSDLIAILEDWLAKFRGDREPLRFEVTRNRLTILRANSDTAVGQMRAASEIDVQTAFNPAFLLDCVQATRGSTVDLILRDGLLAAGIGAVDDPDFRVMLMPVRVAVAPASGKAPRRSGQRR